MVVSIKMKVRTPDLMRRQSNYAVSIILVRADYYRFSKILEAFQNCIPTSLSLQLQAMVHVKRKLKWHDKPIELPNVGSSVQTYLENATPLTRLVESCGSRQSFYREAGIWQ